MTFRSILVSCSGLLFALTGVLIATSVYNTASSGIPLFYVLLLVPLARCFLPTLPHLTTKFSRSRATLYLILAFQAAALLVATLGQLVWFSRSPSAEFLHLVARAMFIAYFGVCLRYARGKIGYSTLVWTRRLLIFVFFYGIYQLPAKLLGWPLFLDWLRNSKSYFMYDYNAGGWTDMIRATSVYAEPSHATVPVLVGILLNIYLPAGRASKAIGWVAIVLFGIAASSRTMWAAVAALVAILVASRFRATRPLLQQRRLAALAMLALVFALLPLWGFVAVNGSDNDLSKQERAASIVIGAYMAKDSPVIGLGWNSPEKLADRYFDKVQIADADEVEAGFIQNMPVSYWEQAGIPGLLLAFLPFFVLWCWSEEPAPLTWATAYAFLVAAEFGGDIGYYSLTWLWIALLVNMKSIRAAGGLAELSPASLNPDEQSAAPNAATNRGRMTDPHFHLLETSAAVWEREES